MLQDLVHSYNHTYHSSIGMPPATISVKNESLVRQKPGKTKMAVRHRPTSENQQAKASIRERLLARMVGRNFHHQQEISHYSGHLRYQRRRRWRDKRKVLLARASIDYQGGQHVWRRKSFKDEKAKRQNRILRKVERLPDKFNSWIDSCSLVSVNVGSSAGLNSRKKR